MDTLSNVKAGVIGVIVLLALPALAQAATQSAFTQQTTVAAVVHKGDDVIVNTDDAPLMIGSKVLARLTSGQKLPVTAIQGAWLGTHLMIGGTSQSGWVLATDVMLARPNSKDRATFAEQSSDRETAIAGPRRFMAFRPVAAESESPATARNCPTPSQESYGPGEWDYRWSGHHEPDPNIHAWEPWLHH